MKSKTLLSMLVLVLALVALAGCGAAAAAQVSPTPVPTAIPAPTATPKPATYDDPFAYCAAVGTIVTPGADYTGDKVPETVATGLQTALNAPDTPVDVLQNGSFWRCMDGSVYACFVGANLPCESKADMSKTPNDAENDFCKQNPNSDFIPAAATGHETVYEWRCTDGAPAIVKQAVQTDAQGFLADFWYKLDAPQ